MMPPGGTGPVPDHIMRMQLQTLQLQAMSLGAGAALAGTLPGASGPMMVSAWSSKQAFCEKAVAVLGGVTRKASVLSAFWPQACRRYSTRGRVPTQCRPPRASDSQAGAMPPGLQQALGSAGMMPPPGFGGMPGVMGMGMPGAGHPSELRHVQTPQQLLGQAVCITSCSAGGGGRGNGSASRMTTFTHCCARL